MGDVDIKHKIVSIIPKVDKFFDDRAKEASLPLALMVLVFIIFLSIIAAILTKYSGSFELFFLAIKLAPETISNLAISEGIKFAVLLILYPLSIWVVTKFYFEKSWETSITKITYVCLMPVAFFFSASLLVSFIGAIDYGFFESLVKIILLPVSLLIIFISFSLGLVTIKKVSNAPYTKVVTTYFVAGFMAGFAFFVVGGVVQNFWYHNDPTTSSLNFSITNHSDGSFTVQYENARYLKEEVYYRELCNVSFPEGWVVSSEEEYLGKYGKSRGLYNKGDNGYRLVYKKSLWNTTTPEYIFFEYLLSIGTDKVFYYSDTANRDALGERTEIGKDVYITKNVNRSFNKEYGIGTYDEYLVSEDNTVARHQAYKSFLDLLLVDMKYRGVYGRDQDFYYILNSITCKKIGG